MTSEIPPLKASILFISNKQLTNLRDTGLWYVAVTTLFPDYRGSCKFSLLTFLPPCGIMQLVQTKCRQLYISYTGHALPYHLC